MFQAEVWCDGPACRPKDGSEDCETVGKNAFEDIGVCEMTLEE